MSLKFMLIVALLSLIATAIGGPLAGFWVWVAAAIYKLPM